MGQVRLTIVTLEDFAATLYNLASVPSSSVSPVILHNQCLHGCGDYTEMAKGAIKVSYAMNSGVLRTKTMSKVSHPWNPLSLAT